MAVIEFNVITIFTEMFKSPFDTSLIKKAVDKGIIEINLFDLRDYSENKHKNIDDYSYGGGAGMVMQPKPFVEAINAIKRRSPYSKIILTSPQGEIYSHKKAIDLSKERSITILCGRYEGIDERVTEYIDEEISIGDYVLTGGEIPAMTIIDTVSRLVDGVVGEKDSIVNDSFFNSLLDYPHYTRPYEFNGSRVPDVLMSGNHKKIENWRRLESLKRTLKRRPELIDSADLTEEERTILDRLLD